MSRLHSRIYVHSLAVLLVVGLLTTAILAWGVRSAFLTEIGERMARHVASLVGEQLGDSAALAGRLRQIREDFEVDVTVRDLAGRVVAVAGPELPALGHRDLERVMAGAVVVYSEPVWFAAAPVRDPRSGAAVGMLAASVQRRLEFAGLFRPVLLVALVLVVVALATRPLARRISRPLERLTEGARRLGGGDLSYRVPARTEGRWGWRRGSRADELQELTRAFNEMAERVERLVRVQSELLANVSHELRSPLTRIRMALELVPRDGTSAARLDDVERDLTELDRLIDDVLTAARLEATGLPTRLETVDVRELLEQLAARAGRDPVLAAVAVSAVPGPALSLVADGVLLRRALWNLIENAAKYGVSPIRLAASGEGDRIALSVEDAGPGVAPDEREHVFAPFYRADRARTPGAAGEPSRGVGLGLTLARRVAEVHGGTIEIGPATVENGQERGCRVVITLPPQG